MKNNKNDSVWYYHVIIFDLEKTRKIIRTAISTTHEQPIIDTAYILYHYIYNFRIIKKKTIFLNS